MKKLLLPVLACGMFPSAVAQIEIPKKNKAEVSDKWVITPVPTMKGVLGRLDINFPADVERNILIYQPADNKFITSVSWNDKIYTIAPGQYRFTLTSVPVDNVPIQKGHETRIKMGFLNVVSEGDWHLYNDTKEKAYTSGNKPKKLPLPVGSYQVKLGGQFYPVIIKDGETVEDYTPVEVKDETPVEIKKEDKFLSEFKNTKAVDPSVFQQWVITPIESRMGASLDSGILNTYFPGDTNRFLKYWELGVNENSLGEAYVLGNDIKTKTLVPGTYLVGLNKFYLFRVPIVKGNRTRIKVGYVDIDYQGEWTIAFKYLNFGIGEQWSIGPNIVALPVGNYRIIKGKYEEVWEEKFNEGLLVVVKDRETLKIKD